MSWFSLVLLSLYLLPYPLISVTRFQRESFLEPFRVPGLSKEGQEIYFLRDSLSNLQINGVLLLFSTDLMSSLVTILW